MAIRILITGSRNWTDRETIGRAIDETVSKLGHWGPKVAVTIVHGAAKGADTLAADYARASGYTTEAHPADWDRYGKAAGHRRNAEMVALGANVCLAFPLGESKGTRGCMALAEKAGITVRDLNELRRRSNLGGLDGPVST